jgi:hypothetical protein
MQSVENKILTKIKKPREAHFSLQTILWCVPILISFNTTAQWQQDYETTERKNKSD